MTLKKDGCIAGISYLVSEWTAGIQLPGTQPPQRTLPVKQLEADKVNGRGDRRWRSGSKIRTTVAWKKHFWFAYERRTLGHPLSSSNNKSDGSNNSRGNGGGASNGSDGGSGSVGGSGVNSNNGSGGSSGSGGSGSNSGGGDGSNIDGSSIGSSLLTRHQAVEDLEVMAR